MTSDKEFSITEFPNLPAVADLPVDAGALPLDMLATTEEPVVLRGLVDHWPVVRMAQTSDEALLNYLLKFDEGTVVPVSAGSPSLGGRIFYNHDYNGPNAERGTAKLSEVLMQISEHGAKPSPPLIYLASASVGDCLPGFREENDLQFEPYSPLVSIWLGTRTRIAAHNDLPLNVACVVAGERRFILFPPDQLANLYVGPFELTPAGRPISFVDFEKPDLEKFPRFSEALKAATVAELSPGDALFIPSMWWHHVEATGSFNALVNYWWRTVPSFLGTPQDVLNHAMLTIRDLPETEKEIWRDIFDYYIFRNSADIVDHIPEHIRGILAPMNEERARSVRAFLLNRLNR